MTTFFITTVTIGLISAAALYFSRHEPLRNGYQARVRTRMKGGKVVILEPKDDPRIVCDILPAEVDRALRRKPRTARIRDMSEPMGM